MLLTVAVYGVVAVSARALPASDEIDALVRATVMERGLTPAPPCSDAVFRRVYLDVIGTLSSGRGNTISSGSACKNARCINRLLAREEFNDYWTLKWCDLLRVKAEFPIACGPTQARCITGGPRRQVEPVL